jgi:IS605 OrfB family transposase
MMDMEVVRTVPVKLDVDSDTSDALYETVLEFKQAANIVVANCRNDDGYVVTAKNQLHDRTYEQVRTATDLHANMVQAARSRAADALKATVARWQKGQYAELPEFTADFAEYDKRSATFHDDHASLATVEGRVEVSFDLPDTGDNPHSRYIRNPLFEPTSATLHHRDDDWYLHIRTKAEVDGPDHAGHLTVLGVDLNAKGSFAVTSTGAFFGSADQMTHVRDEYERVRCNLQQTGTESAHRTIGSLGGRFSRWSEDYLHRVSKRIVHEAADHDCTAIALEDLTDIRDRMANASRFQQWAFRQMYEYVEYKATVRGIKVLRVDPAYTSQRCSKCGTTLEKNRDGEAFECLKCGYAVHADYNAAKNIAMKHVRDGQKSRDGRAPRQCALKSGTVTASGDFTPAGDRPERESTDKPTTKVVGH